MVYAGVNPATPDGILGSTQRLYNYQIKQALCPYFPALR